ncbi:MAG: Archaeal seryl-tRNA synthetase-related sequence [Myxococcales bacterium]|nr:Archaeal seryl-tRNA synthetase-related sequence [Myxococcales bacterium]
MSRAAARFSLDLDRELDGDLASDLEKQGGFVSPHVKHVQVDGRAVNYELTDDAPAEVHEKLRRYVDVMISRFRKIPRRVIHARTRRAPRPLERDVFARLVAAGWARDVGPGQVSLSGPALRALHAVDDHARALALAAFGAREESYPTLIPTRTLGRCGYLSSFPQNVSLVTHLVEDFDAIESFRRAHANETTLRPTESDKLVSPPCCLSPALCYHCYAGLEGRTLGPGPEIVTTRGKCFRYESINMTGLERLWDFTMREIVFVGTEEEVVERRARAIAAVEAQIDLWDLAGEIETANDPFFSAAYAGKTYAQRRGELKFELRLPAGETEAGAREIACASFNLHDDFFGRTFSITTRDGHPAWTGCVGWGLERWVLALFAQHGFERADWPSTLRDPVWG